MSDGMTKNLDVCREEWDMYKRVVSSVTYRAGQEKSFARKVHVLSGLLPDAHRTMPRTLSYLALVTTPIIIAVVVWSLI